MIIEDIEAGNVTVTMSVTTAGVLLRYLDLGYHPQLVQNAHALLQQSRAPMHPKNIVARLESVRVALDEAELELFPLIEAEGYDLPPAQPKPAEGQDADSIHLVEKPETVN